ncbi:uncharacterized protein LOC117101259 [Anneissia japonica]|uniref:uncharacterized protein LOC117101259 n=1 Tax=Anneissia japonica TaxID=1529436 RepID=UPI001425A2A4|nr:uncharacterized protein LOC117101259 [Anneissia japonica]
MENILHELTTVTWSHRSYTPNELAKRASFPIVVKASSREHGNEFYQDFNNDQVLYLHGIKEQFRFLAWDVKQNEISIPINSPVTFLEPGSRDNKVILKEDMKLPQYIKIDLRRSKHDFSQLMCLTEEDEIILNVKRRGWMKYLIGVSLSKTCSANKQGLWRGGASNSELCSLNGEVGSCMESIPVDCCEMQFYIALDLRDETIEDFFKFESCVTDLVISTHQHQLDSYQGNTDFIINAQPNYIDMLAEISTAISLQENATLKGSKEKHKNLQKKKEEANIYTDTNINDSLLHDLSTLKGSSENCKKLQKEEKNPHYTNMDKSQMATSSYQNLTSLGLSSEEYDYPQFDDDYENMEDDLLLLDNAKQKTYQKCNEDKHHQFLSMHRKVENAEVSTANNLPVNIINSSYDNSILKGSTGKHKKLLKNKENTNLYSDMNMNDSSDHDRSTLKGSKEKHKKLHKKKEKTNLNTDMNTNESPNYESTSTGSTEKRKKLQKQKKNPHYTNTDKGQMSTNSYQNSTLLGLSSDEYEYPEFYEGYENIQDDVFSLKNTKQKPVHKCSEDKNNPFLSMDGKEENAVNKSQMATSSYQNLTSLGLSSEEYDYPQFDDSYENNDSSHHKSTLKGSTEKHKKLQKKKKKSNCTDKNINDKLQKKKKKPNHTKPGKSQMKTRSYHNLTLFDEGYEMTNVNSLYDLLSLEEAIQKPDDTCKDGKNRVSPSEDDKEYSVPMKQANMKNLVTSEENYSLTGMKQGAKKKMIVDGKEDKHGYLIPLTPKTRMKTMDKVSQSEDDKEYLVPMKHGENGNDKKHVTTVHDQKDDYLVPIKHETRIKRRVKASHLEDDREFLIPMKQGKNMEKQVNLKEMDYLVPMNEEANVIKLETLEDNEGYLVPVKQAANANDKKQITDDDEEDDKYEYPDPIEQEIPMKQEENMVKQVNLKEMDYLVAMNEEANVIKPTTSEDNEGYLVPVKQAANANDKKQITDDDEEDDKYEYPDPIEQEIPMKQEESMKKQVHLKEMNYLVTMNEEANVIKPAASEDNEGYLVPVKQAANANDKKQITDDDEEDDKYEYPDPIEQEIPMKQEESMKKQVHLKEMNYLVTMNEEANVIKPAASEDNEGYLVPVTQAANANDKKQITEDEEDDEYEYPDPIQNETGMMKMDKALLSEESEFIILIHKDANRKKKTAPISVHDKDYFISRKEKEDAKKKHESLHFPKKNKVKKIKRTECLAENSQEQMQKDHYRDKPIPFVQVSEDQNAGQESVQDQRNIYKQTANDVMKFLPKLPFISADDLKSQSKKLKPIVSRKTDRKNRKAVVIGGLNSIQHSYTSNTHSYALFKDNEYIHS